MRAFIIAVMIAVVSALVTKVTEIPVNRWLNGPQVVAHAAIGPYWDIPSPASKPSEDKVQRDFESMAKITITNESNSVAQNGSIRFHDTYPVLFASYDYAGKREIFDFDNPKGNDVQVHLPSLKPGETLDVFVMYHSVFIDSLLEGATIYSSIGKTKIPYDGVLGNGEYPLYADSDIFTYLWRNIYFFSLMIFIIVTIIVVIAAVEQESGIKKVLDDDDLYLQEAAKYRADPKQYIFKSKKDP